MDKETLSNYGWIVICVLILAVMIALATPFGTFVSNAIKSTTNGLFAVNSNALENTGLIDSILHQNIVPDGATYYVGVKSKTIGDYSGATAKYSPGDYFPETVSDGDVYVYGDYEYRYNYAYVMAKQATPTWLTFTETINRAYSLGAGEILSYKLPLTNGWSATVLDRTKQSYEKPLNSINNQPLISLVNTYTGCVNLQTPPPVPTNVVVMYGTYYQSGITTLPNITKCDKLKTIRSAFRETNITDASNFIIPSSVVDCNTTFADTPIVKAPKIPKTVLYVVEAFIYCDDLEGTVIIDANPTHYVRCFQHTSKRIDLKGTSILLQELAKTDDYDNVGIHDNVRVGE